LLQKAIVPWRTDVGARRAVEEGDVGEVGSSVDKELVTGEFLGLTIGEE
jgi:hypothetical protein